MSDSQKPLAIDYESPRRMPASERMGYEALALTIFACVVHFMPPLSIGLAIAGLRYGIAGKRKANAEGRGGGKKAVTAIIAAVIALVLSVLYAAKFFGLTDISLT